MKKVILGALALIFAIALVIGGYILFTSRGLEKYVVAEGVPCPYSWQELRNDTIRLEIDAAAYPGCNWGVESYPKNVAAAAEGESAEGKVVFSILPLNGGQTYIQVYCEQTEPFTVRVFEIGMQVEVSENGDIAVLETAHKAYDGIARLGEAENSPASWWKNADGTVNLLIAGAGGSWEAVNYDAKSIAVSGPFYREDSCGFEIRGEQVGTFPLTIYNGKEKAFVLEIAVAEDLTAAITDFTEGTYAPDRGEEHAALESVAGSAVKLPPQAIATDYFVRSKVGSVEFLLADSEWTWQIDTANTEAELSEEYAAYASETETAEAHGMKLTAYRNKDGVNVFWTDGTCAMTLEGETEVALSDALAVAQQIVEENHGQ